MTGLPSPSLRPFRRAGRIAATQTGSQSFPKVTSLSDSSGEQGSYSHGYGVTSDNLSRRTAQTSAGFFVPYLESGMSLLDCGCGPGSLTTSLAQLVAPGRVVGIDIGESQVERAREHAAEAGVSNVEFQVGGLYELPFDDSSFDSVFSNTVLQHVPDPVRALREWNRVLKPGGVLGIREEDWGSLFYWPETPLLREAYDLYFRYWQENGGNPYLPRQYRRILRESGFDVIEMAGEVNVSATSDRVAAVGNYGSTHWLEPVFAEAVVDRGWVTREHLEKLANSFEVWAADPDAFTGLTFVSAVARRPA